AAMAGGDTFAVPAHAVGQSPSQVAKVFGPDVADAIARVEPGTWAGPIRSPYGAHLVWIEGRDGGEPAPLETVRGGVLERWRETERARRLAGWLRDAERRYPLQIESRVWRDRSRS